MTTASAADWAKKSAKIDLMLRKVLFDKFAHLKNSRLTIVDPLGEVTLGSDSEDGLSARIDVFDLSFYRQLSLGGPIGVAESYMNKCWQADDLTHVIQILIRNRDLLDTMEGGLATLANQMLRFWYFARRNTPPNAPINIAAHYDLLGDDMFSLFLDRHGLYSSATFHDLELSLENASAAKLERICQKLDLRITDHVLEIGTGWGGFAVYAAKNYGCRITTTTISKKQHQAAQERFKEEGLSDRVTVLLEDYRNLSGCYDKLVSIEMIEAIGHHYLDTYFRQCSKLLKQNGLALIQAITIEDQRYKQALKRVDFIKRHIFPGSFIPSVHAIVDSAARCTDLRLINLEDQGESYALTLKNWRERFMASLDQGKSQGYDESFIRMWEFYLCYCESGFREKLTSNVQLLFAKPGNRRPE